jgi:hypothetical protein
MPPIYFEIDSDTLDFAADRLRGLGTDGYYGYGFTPLEGPERRIIVKRILEIVLSQEIKEIES